jgi:hypothetical protein
MIRAIETGRIWVFNEAALEEALTAYRDKAVDAYPHQQERIGIAVAAIRDFLYGPHADPLTMTKGRG